MGTGYKSNGRKLPIYVKLTVGVGWPMGVIVPFGLILCLFCASCSKKDPVSQVTAELRGLPRIVSVRAHAVRYGNVYVKLHIEQRKQKLDRLRKALRRAAVVGVREFQKFSELWVINLEDGKTLELVLLGSGHYKAGDTVAYRLFGRSGGPISTLLRGRRWTVVSLRGPELRDIVAELKEEWTNTLLKDRREDQRGNGHTK